MLQHPLSPIPPGLQQAYNAYQYKHYWRFLLTVNLLGQAAYLFYWIADAILIPDVSLFSLATRSLFIALTLPVVLALFHWSNNVRLLDQILPLSILLAAANWFGLLAQSHSPQVSTYLYASLIFIVLANLGVQVRFFPAFILSLMISLVTLYGVYRLTHGNNEAMLVYSLVFLPVLFFSLFISWSTTLERRRAFLRAVLDDMTRHELSQANQQLKSLAHTDALTGLSNRRYFEQQGQLEVARAQRHNHPLCLLLLDVDYFKQINDTHGHPQGDKVLQALSIAAQGELRESDLLARYGGDEFIISLPHTPLIETQVIAERILLTLSHCQVLTDAGEEIPFTVSIGISQLTPRSGTLESLLKEADQALYRAKESGRNALGHAQKNPATV
jgi:diguanylate cyclase (GGDEF)-like protein